MHIFQSINTAKLLGYLGLIPFFLLTAILLSKPYHQVFWQQALLSYGAVILTFVGALHWSFAMQLQGIKAHEQRNLFIWSVVPSLAAWLALLLPMAYGLSLLVIFFVLAWWRDERLAKIVSLANWYIPLRRTLTLIVTGCLLIAIFLTKS